MTKPEGFLLTALGGMISGTIIGAVGANLAENSSGRHPVLKGALGAGAVVAAFNVALVAVEVIKLPSSNGTVSGPPQFLGFP